MAKPAAVKISTETIAKPESDLHLRVVEPANKFANPQALKSRAHVAQDIADDVDDLWDNVPV